ncbi:Uma2 family endonuclease [Roseomonas sp. OT10]|uniref:Uma2 family endonuclease n=1 Tax=Roseomonas cutis TaxID=2897332 RepID=UPI001E6548D4|nr:Uma2 family endonuclease [Roseomonas sp. OT10]UFN49142.1 Uma2 family endonuclease [Roseomonas sp. OT10]
MSQARHRKPSMTLTEFLAWEEQQLVRYEFDGFQPVAMTGGTAAHARIQRNLSTALDTRLRGSPCEFLGSDIKVLTARTCRYPDGMVTCTRAGDSDTAAPAPVILFEVLSRSTADDDFGAKNIEYMNLPSVRRYVLIDQKHVHATVFSRIDGQWQGRVLTDGDTLDLPEVGVELPLRELYRGLDLTAEAAEEPGASARIDEMN